MPATPPPPPTPTSPIDPLGIYNWQVNPVTPGTAPPGPSEYAGYVTSPGYTQTNFGQFSAPNMAVSAGAGQSGLQQEAVQYQGPSTANALVYKNNVRHPVLGLGGPAPGSTSPDAAPLTIAPSLMPTIRGDTMAQNLRAAGAEPDLGKFDVGPGRGLLLKLIGGGRGMGPGPASSGSSTNSKTMHLAPATLIQPSNSIAPPTPNYPAYHKTPNTVLSNSPMRVPGV